MKSQISPGLAAVIIVIVLAGVGFFVWRGMQGPAGAGGGKLQSNLDSSKVSSDPATLQAQLQEDLKKQEAGKGK